jgi:hypothetical protein
MGFISVGGNQQLETTGSLAMTSAGTSPKQVEDDKL